MVLILIFGGAYQGKLAYALERFDMSDSEVFRCDDVSTCAPAGKKIIYELDRWILALIKADMDSNKEEQELIEANKDAIIICNDISCGVVPIDPIMRKWRDETGKALGKLAQASGEVIRLYCGIPSKLK